jgi:hypothetical protein
MLESKSARAGALPKRTPQAAMRTTPNLLFRTPNMREDTQELRIMTHTLAQRVAGVN